MGLFLGIDVGSRVVSVALLDVGYRKLALKALSEAAVTDPAAIGEAVASAVGGLAQHTDSIAASIDGDLTFTHRLTLPPTALKQLDEILNFELEAALPVPLDELIWGHRVLPRKTAKDPVVVLVGAARVEQVRARIELVKAAIGREPDSVRHGAITLANLSTVSAELRRPEPIALVDLGGKRTEITILVGGEVAFVRTLSRGVDKLPEGAPALAAEIRQTLVAWLAREGDPITTVHLVGGGAAASGAAEFLAYELGIPVTALPPLVLEGMTPEQAASLPRFAKAVALALGAAGRGHHVDLRRGPLTFQRGFSFLKEKAPLLIGLAGAVLVSFLFAVWAELRAVGKDFEAATSELERTTLAAFEQATSDPEEAQNLLEQAKNPAESDPMPRMDAFDVMVEISKAVPASVTHDIEELDLQRGHVRIQGIVGSTADASLVRDNLATVRCVNDPKIAKVTQVVNGTRQKYVLEFDVKCPEEGAKKKAATPAGSASATNAEGEAP
ncbi:MAG TPA: pilus assembly protein PilM [Polyangiaceae bacterium]